MEGKIPTIIIQDDAKQIFVLEDGQALQSQHKPFPSNMPRNVPLIDSPETHPSHTRTHARFVQNDGCDMHSPGPALPHRTKKQRQTWQTT